MMLKEIFDTLSLLFLKHFVFLFYGNNTSDQTFSKSNGTISGDMFFNEDGVWKWSQ